MRHTAAAASRPRWPVRVTAALTRPASPGPGPRRLAQPPWNPAPLLHRGVVDACASSPQLSELVDSSTVLMAGHSRGGKLSALAAADDRVKGVALLDPVDVTSMMPLGPNYPSALPSLRVASSPPRSMPVLVVGAVRAAPQGERCAVPCLPRKEGRSGGG